MQTTADEARKMILQGTMTWALWKILPKHVQDAARDVSDLTPQLRGLEGYRVEVVDDGDESETLRRFIVGRSTGWRPIHLELKRRNSSGGEGAARHYASVKVLERVHPY